jgi:hypothetical protein
MAHQVEFVGRHCNRHVLHLGERAQDPVKLVADTQRIARGAGVREDLQCPVRQGRVVVEQKAVALDDALLAAPTRKSGRYEAGVARKPSGR